MEKAKIFLQSKKYELLLFAHTIEQIFLHQKDRILNAENHIFEATEDIYKAIDKRIEVLVKETN